MIGQPLVSVVVPSYNAENFIGATLQSVAQQSYANWEVIVVDDCSTDGTRDLVRAFAIRDERIQLVAMDTNSNLPAVPRNIGIRRATGDLVAFLDHDDLWFKRKLERHVAAHLGNSDLAMTHSALLNFPGHFDPRELRHLPIPVHPMSSLDRLKAYNTVMCSSAVVQTEVLTQLEGFNESPELRAIEDYELWLRIGERYQLGYLPEVLGLYRVSPLGTFHLEDMNSRLATLRVRGRIKPPPAGVPLPRKLMKASFGLACAVWNYALRGLISGQLGLRPSIY